MSVNHPASPGAARRVDYFDFGVDGGAMSALPRKRTCAVQLGMSALCQKQTSPALFNNVISAGEERGRYVEAERL